jgi:hypothetical protein
MNEYLEQAAQLRQAQLTKSGKTAGKGGEFTTRWNAWRADRVARLAEIAGMESEKRGVRSVGDYARHATVSGKFAFVEAFSPEDMNDAILMLATGKVNGLIIDPRGVRSQMIVIRDGKNGDGPHEAIAKPRDMFQLWGAQGVAFKARHNGSDITVWEISMLIVGKSGSPRLDPFIAIRDGGVICIMPDTRDKDVAKTAKTAKGSAKVETPAPTLKGKIEVA